MNIMNIINKMIHKKDRPYIIIAIVLGFLNHFLYDWSDHTAFTALFCPVNESVWEHLKLLFFPLLFVSVLEYLRSKGAVIRFFYYRFLSAIGAMGSVIVLFYTYTGIIGRNYLVVDISVFLSGVLIAFAISRYCWKRQWKEPSQSTTFSMWVVVALLFFAFTCFPPDIPLFFPPS